VESIIEVVGERGGWPRRLDVSRRERSSGGQEERAATSAQDRIQRNVLSALYALAETARAWRMDLGSGRALPGAAYSALDEIHQAFVARPPRLSLRLDYRLHRRLPLPCCSFGSGFALANRRNATTLTQSN